MFRVLTASMGGRSNLWIRGGRCRGYKSAEKILRRLNAQRGNLADILFAFGMPYIIGCLHAYPHACAVAKQLNKFKTTFKNYNSYEAFEIATPRWVHSLQGWNWLVCVRFYDAGRRRSYVLLLNGSTSVDAHYAVQTDDCGKQPYSALEQMGAPGLPPLH